MSFKEFNIGRDIVGNEKRCFIIGEVAQAHEGSLGMAHAFIDAMADAGVDAVKFQTLSLMPIAHEKNHGESTLARRTRHVSIIGNEWSLVKSNGLN